MQCMKLSYPWSTCNCLYSEDQFTIEELTFATCSCNNLVFPPGRVGAVSENSCLNCCKYYL